MLRITALMENKPSANRAIISEHGLSLLVERDGYRILFDFGQSRHFIDNAHRLGIPLSGIDAAVISHGHYDHAAGFRDFLESGFRVPVLYTGKDFFGRKYSRKGMRYADLSSGYDEAFVLSHGVRLRTVEHQEEIVPGISVISGFGRIHEEEIVPERFVREADSRFIPDDFHDEAALCIETGKGLVLIAGCSHPGIMNMADTVRARMDRDIYAVVGGTHLSEADDERAFRTFSYLRDTGVSIAALCHCTGESAERIASGIFGDRAAGLSAGECLILG